MICNHFRKSCYFSGLVGAGKEVMVIIELRPKHQEKRKSEVIANFHSRQLIGIVGTAGIEVE